MDVNICLFVGDFIQWVVLGKLFFELFMFNLDIYLLFRYVLGQLFEFNQFYFRYFELDCLDLGKILIYNCVLLFMEIRR